MDAVALAAEPVLRGGDRTNGPGDAELMNLFAAEPASIDTDRTGSKCWPLEAGRIDSGDRLATADIV